MPEAALYAAALLFVVLIAFLPALRNGFVWDDQSNLVNRDRLRSPGSIVDVFRRPAMWSADLPQGPIGTYRPLSLTSFIIDYKLYGVSAGGFHFTSIVLHALAMLMVLLLLLRWRVPTRAAFFLTLLIAFHPSCVEAVVWINGRSEIFALLFGAAALVMVSRRNIRHWHAAAAGFLLLLAMLGKETGVIFIPLAILAASFEPGEKNGSPMWKKLHVPAALATAGALAAYFLLRLAALSGSTLPASSSWLKALPAVPALWLRALQTSVFPLERAPVSVALWLANLSLFEKIATTAAAAGLAALLVYCVKKRRTMIAVGLGWWLAAILPAGFIATVAWPGLNRWLYIGLPGLALALYFAFAHLLRPRFRQVLTVVLVTWFLFFTERAIPAWRSDATLFATMIRETPDDPFGYQALGVELMNQQQYDKAAGLFHEAIELGPTQNAVYGYLAMCLIHLDSCDEALHLYMTYPDPTVSHKSFRKAARECYYRTGRPDQAKWVDKNLPDPQDAAHENNLQKKQ